jgi:hypothetical protein
MLHQFLASVEVRATEVAVEDWLGKVCRMVLVEVVLIQMLAVWFLFMLCLLLLGDILIAVPALTTIWVVDHCLLELTFATFRKFVSTNDLEDVSEVFIRETQARGIACQTVLKRLEERIRMVDLGYKLLSVDFIALLSFIFIFTWWVDFELGQDTETQIMVNEA